MQPKTFETTSRHLEQFLFIHDIRWIKTYQNQDNACVWVYFLTPETSRIIEEFRSIIARRSDKRRK